MSSLIRPSPFSTCGAPRRLRPAAPHLTHSLSPRPPATVRCKSLPEEAVTVSLREKETSPPCACCANKGAVLCVTCSGSGMYVDAILESQGVIVKVTCLGCGGTGNIMCPKCGGRGHL